MPRTVALPWWWHRASGGRELKRTVACLLFIERQPESLSRHITLAASRLSVLP
jgi:hypothetical protein